MTCSSVQFYCLIFLDASALYDKEELDMIQDILRDDQQRDRITTTPDDDTELTVARPMPAGVFHGRGKN